VGFHQFNELFFGPAVIGMAAQCRAPERQDDVLPGEICRHAEQLDCVGERHLHRWRRSSARALVSLSPHLLERARGMAAASAGEIDVAVQRPATRQLLAIEARGLSVIPDADVSVIEAMAI
jgi:hypothetical protein